MGMTIIIDRMISVTSLLPLNPFVFGCMSLSHTLHEVQVHGCT